MSYTVRVNISPVIFSQNNADIKKEILDIAKKWKVDMRNIPDETIEKVPGVALSQVKTRLKLRGMSWKPGSDHVIINVVNDRSELSEESLDRLNDAANTNLLEITSEGIHIKTRSDDTGDDNDAHEGLNILDADNILISAEELPEFLEKKIKSFIDISFFYVVGALNTLSIR